MTGAGGGAPAQSKEASWLATMHPAYFAMVMATGIVSIACQLLGLQAIAAPLVWLNIAFYVGLWMLTALRIARFRQRVGADLFHHGRSVGFFTTVAATSVLGSQLIVVYDARAAARLPPMRPTPARRRCKAMTCAH